MADGVVIGTLGDLAAVPGMLSEPSLRKLIKENPDFPVISTGRNGVPYEIDVAAAVAWLQSHEEKQREASRARSDEVRQLAMDLMAGDTAADHGNVGLSIQERKLLLEEEILATKLALQRGSLVRKATVEAAWTAVFSLLSEQRRSLTAKLAKRTDLTRAQQSAIDQLLERDLSELADKFEEMGRDGAASTDMDDSTV